MIAALRSIWRLFTPQEQRKASWVLLLVVVMAFLETVGVVSVMPFLSVLGNPEAIHDNRWLAALYRALGVSSDRSFIALLGLISIALVVSSSLFKVFALHSLNRFVHLQRHSLSVRLLSKYLHQPYDFFLSRSSAELSKNVLSEVDMLVNNLLLPVAQMIAQGLIVLAVTLIIFIYDPRMAVNILLIIGTVYGLIYALVRKRLFRIGVETQCANRERFQSCNEALAGIKDIKINNAIDAYSSHFNQSARQFARHQAANDTISQTPLYLIEAVGYTSLILLAIVLMLKSNDIGQVLPALGLYGLAAYRILPAAQVMYRGLARLRFSTDILSKICQDFALPVGVASSHVVPIVPVKDIRLENIRFAYPGSPGKPVLDNFSLTLSVGKSLAITGKSGSGKSTLMDILLGLLRPQSGKLIVDEKEISPEMTCAWQSAIGYVPQHIFLADASVIENIAIGIPKAEIDIAAAQNAAKVAEVHDFIVSDLPSGYDSPIGERGIRLSGGQRQRIGIARALYRDISVLILDEATSALDLKTQSLVLENLRRIRNGLTVVTVTHRAETLAIADEVINLERITPAACHSVS